MAYTAIDDPSAYFQTALYTGDGAGSHAITNGGNSDLQPDWVWIKKRNGAVNHLLHDSVRGVTKLLVSNTDGAEDVNTNIFLGFDSDGFRVGANSASNVDAGTFVAWQWKTGTSFTNDASATSVGSIDSAGSVSTDAGFSIISYTGTGANATIAHGLGSVPKMYIARNIADAENWTTYHVAMGATHHLRLNTNVAKVDEAEVWNDTEPTSTVFSVGSSGAPNGDGDAHIAYCFADVQGYSKFGSYTGNGNANGTFVYTGFKPAFILLKGHTNTQSWHMHDNKRSPLNVSTKALFANNSNDEEDGTAKSIDFLSNGFKLRDADNAQNGDGDIYIYMAFAENPFVTSKGLPGTAR